MTGISKRLMAALIAAILIIPVIGAGTASAQTEGCESYSIVDQLFGTKYHASNYHDNGANLHYDRVGGTFDPTVAGWRLCAYTSGDDDLSAWVGLSPGMQSQYVNDTGKIIQVGIVRSNRIGKAYNINWGQTPAFFYAVAGCGGSLPTAHYIGPADTLAHHYAVDHVGNNYVLKIDLNTVATIAANDSRITCWINGDTRTLWGNESTDGGNSYGDDFDKSNWLNLQYGITGGAYVYESWDPASACNIPAVNSGNLDHKCDRTSTGYGFDVWSIPF